MPNRVLATVDVELAALLRFIVIAEGNQVCVIAEDVDALRLLLGRGWRAETHGSRSVGIMGSGCDSHTVNSARLDLDLGAVLAVTAEIVDDGLNHGGSGGSDGLVASDFELRGLDGKILNRGRGSGGGVSGRKLFLFNDHIVLGWRDTDASDLGTLHENVKRVTVLGGNSLGSEGLGGHGVVGDGLGGDGFAGDGPGGLGLGSHHSRPVKRGTTQFVRGSDTDWAKHRSGWSMCRGERDDRGKRSSWSRLPGVRAASKSATCVVNSLRAERKERRTRRTGATHAALMAAF